MQVLRKSTGAEEESKDHGTVSKNQQKGLSQTNLKWFLIRDCSRFVSPNFLGFQTTPLLSSAIVISFLTVQPFMVKMQFEIYKYFPLFVHCLKYLMFCFEPIVQLVPKFYSLPSCSLLELKLGLL